MTGVAVADFLFLSGGASQLEQQKEHQPVVSRIAFGSCANQDVPQVLFFFSVFFFVSSLYNELYLLIRVNLILILLEILYRDVKAMKKIMLSS